MTSKAQQSLIRLLLNPPHMEQGVELARALDELAPVLEALEQADHRQHRPLMELALQQHPEQIAANITRYPDAGWLCCHLSPLTLRRASLRRLLVSPRAEERAVFQF